MYAYHSDLSRICYIHFYQFLHLFWTKLTLILQVQLHQLVFTLVGTKLEMSFITILVSMLLPEAFDISLSSYLLIRFFGGDLAIFQKELTYMVILLSIYILKILLRECNRGLVWFLSMSYKTCKAILSYAAHDETNYKYLYHLLSSFDKLPWKFRTCQSDLQQTAQIQNSLNSITAILQTLVARNP